MLKIWIQEHICPCVCIWRTKYKVQDDWKWLYTHTNKTDIFMCTKSTQSHTNTHTHTHTHTHTLWSTRLSSLDGFCGHILPSLVMVVFFRLHYPQSTLLQAFLTKNDLIFIFLHFIQHEMTVFSSITFALNLSSLVEAKIADTLFIFMNYSCWNFLFKWCFWICCQHEVCISLI